MAWEFVAKDQSRALLTIVKTDAEGNMLPAHTKVCGLAEDKLYRCSLDQEVRLGRTWNRAGLTLHQVLEEYELKTFSLDLLTFLQQMLELSSALRSSHCSFQDNLNLSPEAADYTV